MFDVLAAAAVIAMSSHYSQAPADTSVVTVEEDDPAFDCRTMGNLRCGAGAVLPDGTLAIPGDYSDPNCWPGAIYCPAPGTPVDQTAR